VFPAPGTKILITGGTGHLGSALVHHLVQDRGLPPSDLRVFFLEGTPNCGLNDIPGLDLRPGDILDCESVRAACRGVDLVFHMAASTSFDPRQKSRQWRTNVEGTRNLLEAARMIPTLRRICHTSTVNVLAAPPSPGSVGRIGDCDPYARRDGLHSFRSRSEVLDFAEAVRRGEPGWERRIGIGYFDSKLAAQEIVSRYVEEHGLDVVSVLPGTLFGPYDTLIGSGIFLLSIFRRKLPGMLRGGISTVHVLDAVEGHLQAMESGLPGGRYVLTGPMGNNLYFRDLAGIIAAVLIRRFPGRKIRRRFPVIPEPAALAAAWISEWSARLRGRPCLLSRGAVRAGSRVLFYSSEDTARDLGYRPVRSFGQAVEEMAEDYDRRGLFADRCA
jgi:dihydroflavonol-4-reductase